MELLVHVSTSGHLLVVYTQEVPIGTNIINVHVIMATPIAHLLLWVMTIFVRVFEQLGLLANESFCQMLCSGMARFVRVVAHVVSSTIHHGSPRT